ncbi:cuticle protein 38-like [Ischnura elegans]|uniref:cuticle protein 38-like n=1 Tax=Ischnura elegans TaxID=197161 RepID=UPI001ED89E1D|nr:cuticle protein 38-like [Ischnura elegans]
MYKLVALLALVAFVSAAPGNKVYYAAPAVVHTPVVHHAHVVHAAPVFKVKTHHVPIATSYANVHKVSIKAPVVHAVPVVHAAPVVHTYHAAPVYKVKTLGLVH